MLHVCYSRSSCNKYSSWYTACNMLLVEGVNGVSVADTYLAHIAECHV